ncbi:Uncharacterised protein r2_g4209 [Pycnogonum litorale]
MKFRFKIIHGPGKELITADTLSRSPLPEIGNQSLHELSQVYVNGIMGNLPATDRRLSQLREAQHEDAVCLKLMEYVQHGWPEKSDISVSLMPFFQFASEYSIQEGLLMKNQRILIPTSMRLEVLDRPHDGHLGIVKCRERAKISVWWPGLSKELEGVIKSCVKCLKSSHDQAEPLITTPLPDRPWQKIGGDLKEIKELTCLVVVDYFSNWIQIAELGRNMKAHNIILKFKQMFTIHGIPDVVLTDNGPNFENHEFREFSTTYGFAHITSSPKYPQSNGAVERAVQTFKNAMNKNQDPYLATLTHRSTPLISGYASSELLMGRRLRTTVPISSRQLQPHFQLESVRERAEEYKGKMKVNYDSRHAARVLPPVKIGQDCYVKDRKESGQVAQPAENAQRSLIVNTPTGTFRRNRRMLVPLPPSETTHSAICDAPDNKRLSTPEVPNTTRSGRVVRPPVKLDL